MALALLSGWTMTRLALIAALSLATSTSACTMSRDARTTTVVGGIGTTILGVAVARSYAVDSDGNGRNDNPLNDDFGQLLLGPVLVGAGIVLFAAGAAADEPATIEPLPPPPPIVAAPHVAPLPVDIGARDLPAYPVSDDVLRLALQARSLTARHHCDAARSVITRIDASDASYAAALRVALPCAELLR